MRYALALGLLAGSPVTIHAAPDPPTDCEASRNSCDYITITWHDNSDDEDGFEIIRTGSVIDSVGADVTEYVDTSAIAGVDLSYRIAAFDAGGRSTPSNTDVGLRLAPPDAPLSLTATNGFCGFVHLTWANQQVLQTGITIWRDGEVLAAVDRHDQAFTDTTPTPGATHAYAVEVSAACGTAITETVDGSASTEPPAPPGALTASETLCLRVHLSWTDESEDETGFEIRRDDQVVAEVDANVTAYDDSSAVVDETYIYTVAALSSCGTSAPSNEAMGVRLENVPLDTPDLVYPPADSAACVLPLIAFAWSTIDGAATYEFQLLAACGGTLLIDEIVDDPMVTYDLDTGTYFWRVRARNECEELGEWSTCRTVMVDADVLDAPQPDIMKVSPTTYHFVWQPIAYADSYRVVVSDLECYDRGKLTQVIETTEPEAIVEWPHEQESLFAWVTALACVASDSTCVEFYPDPPVLLEHFTATPETRGIRLDWRTLQEIGTRGFHVYRNGDGAVRRRVTGEILAGGRGDYTLLDIAVRDGARYVYVLAEVVDNGEVNDIAYVETVVRLGPSVLRLTTRPNPFNPQVTIHVDLPRDGAVRLDVLDASGRLVRRFVERRLDVGRHAIVWDGTDGGGRPLASGVYFLSLRAGDARRTARVVIAR